MAFLQQVFTCPTMVSGNSVTSSIELSGSFQYVYIEIPATTTGYSTSTTPIYIKASSDNTTFRRYSNPELNTSTVGANDFTVVSAASNRMVYIPNFAFRWVQVEISGTATGTGAAPGVFKFITVSNQ